MDTTTTATKDERPTLMAYVREEREKLTAALDAYPAFIDAALEGVDISDRVLALATGSSINAVLSARYYIEDLADVTVEIQEPYNYMNYERHKPTSGLVLGISQSGQSTSTIAALQSLPAGCGKIAVTSIPDSEITDVCDTVLDIQCGRERVGYVTLGFNATVLALMLFGLRMGVKKGLVSSDRESYEIAEFRSIIAAFDEVIEQTEVFFEANREELSDARRFMSIAYGPAFGTAQEMQTKFSECVRVPSQGIDLEAFMHGPYLEMQPDYRLFFLDTPAARHVKEKAALLKTYESDVTPYVYTISVDGMTPKSQRDLALPKVEDDNKCPLLMVLPFQVLTWLVSHGRGIDITHRIFTDFSQRVHSKTTVQDYV